MADPTTKRIGVIARRAALGFHQDERVRLRNVRMKVRERIRERDLEGALPLAVEASELSGEVADIQQLAIILSRLQRWKEAAPLWAALGKGENVPPRSLLLAGRALIRGGKLKEARGAFQRRVEANPDDAVAARTLARIDDRLNALSDRRKAKRSRSPKIVAKAAPKPEVFRSIEAILAARGAGPAAKELNG